MTTKLVLFQKLYGQLRDLVKKIVPNTPFPTLAETILFLNVHAAQDVNADKLESQFESTLKIHQNVNEEEKKRIKDYINAMLDLLKE
jgi:hypothetical protein